jgi:hypothetical protein
MYLTIYSQGLSMHNHIAFGATGMSSGQAEDKYGMTFYAVLTALADAMDKAGVDPGDPRVDTIYNKEIARIAPTPRQRYIAACAMRSLATSIDMVAKTVMHDAINEEPSLCLLLDVDATELDTLLPFEFKGLELPDA